jgi:uncharacterized membrane protein YuzA (DUF378 family)
MFNPILEIISSIYLWFWLAFLVVAVIDWSLGTDKVPEKFNTTFEYIAKYVAPEAAFPGICLLTIVGILTKVLALVFSNSLFGVLATLFGIMSVAYIVLLIAGVLIINGLTSVRQSNIARRSKKDKQKSLTDSE